MDHFKELLTQQKEALQKDIDQVVEDIKTVELKLEEMKDIKSKLSGILRGIEKKLAKL